MIYALKASKTVQPNFLETVLNLTKVEYEYLTKWTTIIYPPDIAMKVFLLDFPDKVEISTFAVSDRQFGHCSPCIIGWAGFI